MDKEKREVSPTELLIIIMVIGAVVILAIHFFW
jgi:hypothetical protein